MRPFARSVAAACDAIAGPIGADIWDCLGLALPTRRPTLERRLLPALHAPLPRRKRKWRVRRAIDYHRITYYGQPNRDTTRAKTAASTYTFHTYATACVVGGPSRYVLGLTAGAEKEPFTAVLIRLLDQVAVAGVAARVVLLDKAFFSIAVVRLLQSRNLPFVIPAVVRGRKPRIGVKAVGFDQAADVRLPVDSHKQHRRGDSETHGRYSSERPADGHVDPPLLLGRRCFLIDNPLNRYEGCKADEIIVPDSAAVLVTKRSSLNTPRSWLCRSVHLSV